MPAVSAHERLVSRWLVPRFGHEVVTSVEIHVAAKRYLCALGESHFQTLRQPSVTSLAPQGGPMSADEVRWRYAGS